MTKEFWELSNSRNLKKTSLTSNTITGLEEYIHTVELYNGQQLKGRYIDRYFKSFEKLRMYFAWYVHMFPSFEAKLKVEVANNYHQAYNPLLTTFLGFQRSTRRDLAWIDRGTLIFRCNDTFPYKFEKMYKQKGFTKKVHFL